MKKQYTAPSMKAYKVKTSSILNASITSGGSNSTGGPTTAEGKGFFDEDWD